MSWIIFGIIAIVLIAIIWMSMQSNTTTPESNEQETSTPHIISVPGNITNRHTIILSAGSDVYSISINQTQTGKAVALNINGMKTTTMGRGYVYSIDSNTTLRVDNIGLLNGYDKIDLTVMKLVY